MTGILTVSTNPTLISKELLASLSLEDIVFELDEAIKEKELHSRTFFLNYNPYDKQRLFHEAGKFCKERLFLAGNRTGKTFTACHEVAMHLTGNYPNWWDGYRYDCPVNAWAASLSREVTRDILQRQYYLGDDSAGSIGLIPDHLIIKKTLGSGVTGFVDTVWVQHSSGGVSTISFKSYDQGREKFQGTQKHIIHFDEEPPRDIYLEALVRTMSTGEDFKGMVILTMTPLLGMTNMILHFTKDNVASNTDTDRFFIQASWDDNPYLTEQDKNSLRAGMMPHEMEARERGIPFLGSGMVYPVAESAITCNPFPIPDHWPRVFALDFGWEDPTAALFFAIDRDNDIAYAYAEYAQNHRTPQQHTYELMRQGVDWIPGVYDPAGKITNQKDGSKLVDLYRQSGIKYLYKADNSREMGVQKVLTRMQNGKLKIFNTLNHTLTELRMYSRDEGVLKDGNDHLMDCMRYAVMSGLSIARSKAMNNSSYDRYMGNGNLQSGSWMRV